MLSRIVVCLHWTSHALSMTMTWFSRSKWCSLLMQEQFQCLLVWINLQRENPVNEISNHCLLFLHCVYFKDVPGNFLVCRECSEALRKGEDKDNCNMRINLIIVDQCSTPPTKTSERNDDRNLNWLNPKYSSESSRRVKSKDATIK